MNSQALPKEFQNLQDPTIDQTAEILQVSTASIHRLCKKGILDRYKVGNLTRIRKESIEELRSA